MRLDGIPKESCPLEVQERDPLLAAVSVAHGIRRMTDVICLIALIVTRQLYVRFAIVRTFDRRAHEGCVPAAHGKPP